MNTSQQTIDNLGDYPIKANSPASKIVLFEDNQAGTQDWKIASPKADGTPGTYITIPAGEKKELYPSGNRSSAATPGQPTFVTSDLVLFVRTVLGSFVLSQEEH